MRRSYLKSARRQARIDPRENSSEGAIQFLFQLLYHLGTRAMGSEERKGEQRNGGKEVGEEPGVEMECGIRNAARGTRGLMAGENYAERTNTESLQFAHRQQGVVN